MSGDPVSDETRQSIGYLPAERGLYPRMPLRKVIVFLAALRGMSEHEANRRASECLERFERTD